MGSLFKYSSIVTKVHGMRNKLLTPKQYEELAGLATYQDLASYLKHLPGYAPVFQDINETKLHRNEVEKLLTLSLFRDYEKLYQFANIEQRKYLKIYVQHFEVILLKECCRVIFNNFERPFDINEQKPFFDHYSSLDLSRLVSSKNIQEFTENLSGTDYQSLFRKLLAAESPKLYDFELALDLFAFQKAWRQGKRTIKGKEYTVFREEFGEKIDLLNLVWVYRAKKYFSMQTADIYALIIPIHLHIKGIELNRLVEAENLEDFNTMALTTYYGHRYRLIESYTIERIYYDCLSHMYQSMWHKNPYSIAALNTYLFVKEEEIHRITTILECIRYGLDRSTALKLAGGEITE